ncbi:trimethylamine methyltransferase family protein [Desulfatitalea alkaliphila]|uniref:Trimethylamine methyltransferase family protein n=1 Tax=Desulfatitalea alkaliphila TaxID=2929485 RepID=A0AA41R2K4_9BACT|nr:trimethylamine methyltransferase family protein [Desulfatitalea alkaliphila]
MGLAFRDGTIVKPYERLDKEEIIRLHKASLAILDSPGIWCYNERAAKLMGAAGAKVSEAVEFGQTLWRIRLPAGLVEECVAMAPSQVVLGARKPENRLLLDAGTPRIYFGSGSETNVWLETEMQSFTSADGGETVQIPRFQKRRGSAALLCRAAHLGEQLEHLDFFIRPVNVQDEGVTEDNHDVNKFFASLNNITKHVQAGLTRTDRLADLVRMGEIITGGPQALRENPIFSFIACVFKSPLQLVQDTADKVFAIVEAGLPIVISSSPQGGSSAPIQEAGMVAQINAEILAGVTFTQLIRQGAPVLYGSVPVRARMDDLHDLYGCPEFNQYNIDCAQLARHYEIPCYSTAGVGDAKVPGMQAMFEKLFTHLYMAMSGAQYIHYAFGLLDRTNTFCPVQAVIDDEQIGKVKHCLRAPKVGEAEAQDAVAMVEKVMGTSHRLFARHARKAIHSGDVSDPYRFEAKGMEDEVIARALDRLAEIEALPPVHLPAATVDRIFEEVPGLLPQLRVSQDA